VGAPLPLACQDWANTKAAYRLWMPGEYSPEVPIEFSPGDLTA
jgi:hypothetical protein